MSENSESASFGERIRGFGPVARKTLKQIGPTRLIVTAGFLILGLLFAKFSWNIMLARDAERACALMHSHLESVHRLLKESPKAVSASRTRAPTPKRTRRASIA